MLGSGSDDNRVDRINPLDGSVSSAPSMTLPRRRRRRRPSAAQLTDAFWSSVEITVCGWHPPV
ncbi:unnamed protein product [Mesocestoides corti]|uniref:Uncharacterized protein n=1 Tax=Mesocestoides corti TaxID=53468 RepID=A0A0R3UDD8_MESCO|nr:unnamed protein product [Mesocestoides corti]